MQMQSNAWRMVLMSVAILNFAACGGASEVDDKSDASDAVCGDGIVEGAEECDDGNTVDGDGCSSSCRIEDPAAVGPCDELEDGDECADGKLCLSGHCITPGCTGDADCASENECVEDGSCDLSTYECVEGAPVASGAECGEAGAGTVCALGQCITPACSSNADCDDGVICNGAETCDLERFECVAGDPPGHRAPCGDAGEVCHLVAGEFECRVPGCLEDEDCPALSACHEPGTCNEATLTCVSGVALDHGASCGDAGEICRVDDDGIECIVPECVADAECESANECVEDGSCDLDTFKCIGGGNAENGTICDLGGAEGQCLSGSCVTGFCEIDADCDNGNACDGAETCVANVCAAGTPPGDGASCGGGDVCLNEQCITPGCTADQDCASQNECREDGSCNLSNFTCVQGAPRTGESCSTGVCNASAQCVAPVCGNGVLEPGEQCDDGNTANNDGCSASCNVETAFRIQSIEIVDPHFFAFTHLSGFVPSPSGCSDITNQGHTVSHSLAGDIDIPAVNGLLGDALNPDPDADDAISLSIVIVADPLSETGGGHMARVLTADCESIDSGCSNFETIVPSATYDNDVCFNVRPGTVTPAWIADLNQPATRCFRSEDVSVSLEFSGISLPLEDASLSGEWAGGTPATAIENGVLTGFLKKSVADNINLVDALGLDVGGTFRLSTLLPGGARSTVTKIISINIDPCRAVDADTDSLDTHDGEDGWWFYINYDATKLNDWQQ